MPVSPCLGTRVFKWTLVSQARLKAVVTIANVRSANTKKNARWQESIQETDAVDIMTSFIKVYPVVAGS